MTGLGHSLGPGEAETRGARLQLVVDLLLSVRR